MERIITLFDNTCFIKKENRLFDKYDIYGTCIEKNNTNYDIAKFFGSFVNSFITATKDYDNGYYIEDKSDNKLSELETSGWCALSYNSFIFTPENENGVIITDLKSQVIFESKEFSYIPRKAENNKEFIILYSGEEYLLFNTKKCEFITPIEKHWDKLEKQRNRVKIKRARRRFYRS